MGRILWTLVGAVLFLGTFGATYFTLAPAASEARLSGALAAVLDDPANTVCLGEAPCADPDAAYDLFVFFSRRDCAIGLYQTAVLDEVYRQVPRSRLNVVGVAYDLDRGTAERLARVSGISYPLYLRTDEMESRFGVVRGEGANKPVMVLVDRAGTVVHSATSGGTVEELEAYGRQLAGRVGRAP
jgi:hypothetical protein